MVCEPNSLFKSQVLLSVTFDLIIGRHIPHDSEAFII